MRVGLWVSVKGLETIWDVTDAAYIDKVEDEVGVRECDGLNQSYQPTNLRGRFVKKKN